MSYRKQLSVALTGHGCATEIARFRKKLKPSKDNYSTTYLLKYKSLSQKGQIANNFTLKY